MFPIVLLIYKLIIVITDFFHLILTTTYLTALGFWHMLSPPKMKCVAGECVLITGTGRGIGKELALQFARLGAKVICLDINQETNTQTVSQIVKEGGDAFGYCCDVSKYNDVKKISEKILEEVGEVTILVNNAGIIKSKQFLDFSPKEVRDMFEVNVFAHFWALMVWLPRMKKNGYGHVVAITSLCGTMGIPNLVPYCSTKFAVTGLMEGLFEELRYGNQNPKLKVTSVHPCIVNTGLGPKRRIRFPSLTPTIATDKCAELIIGSIRRDEDMIIIPGRQHYMYNFLRMFPRKIQHVLIDFIDTGVDVEEE